MRSLKFRAWSNEHNRYCDFVTLDENGRWIGWIKSNGVYLTTADIIVEQYTGLNDKNGKEIYDGDIVKYKLYADSRLDYIDEVFYSTISGAFMAGDEDNVRTLDCLINVEVIGNIHENPELLGGEE